MSEANLTAALPPQRLSRKSEYAYPDGQCRRLEGFSKPLSVMLIIYVVLTSAIALISSYGLVDPRLFDEEALTYIDVEEDALLVLLATAFFFLAIAERLLFFACAFLVGRFTFRAIKNLYTVGSIIPDKSPAATIYWYFVPFANFFAPSSGMSEIHRGSLDEAGQENRSNIVKFWWSAWVVGIIASAVANSSVTPLEVLYPSLMVTMLAFALAAFFLRSLVMRITAAQQVLMNTGAANVFA
jgi:Domain of unknown function (DUF4328)